MGGNKRHEVENPTSEDQSMDHLIDGKIYGLLVLIIPWKPFEPGNLILLQIYLAKNTQAKLWSWCDARYRQICIVSNSIVYFLDFDFCWCKCPE